ncbi:hypothetical protein VPNG_08682 [Cytospora leucostoma]|uniref:Uncharacterized protein n=1 Tax=Cytospora leucostoma TaxID=1230097 RepID=A0A423W2A9_9PEZI|nr:hypothetical protein VPNG_08682 [Cytospora leucostoma]
MADIKAALDPVVSAQSDPKPGALPPARSATCTKLRAHCGRFWIYYVLVIVSLAVIILPILFTIIIPHAAQSIVTRAHLPIRSGSFEAISGDQIALGLVTELNGPSGLEVRFDPFEMKLYNEATDGTHPFTSVHVPAQRIYGRTEIAISKETVAVKNHTELVKWLIKAICLNKTDVSLKAETTAHIGAIKAHINISKKASLYGLDQLSGVRIDSMHLINPEENDGNNFQGIFTLPNKSPLSLGMGNLTLNTWSGDVLIGTATVFDVYLKPGENTIPFTGQILIDALLINTKDILAIQTPTLAKGYLELGISFNSTIINGEHITYLEEALKDVNTTAQLHERAVLRGFARSLIGPNKTVSFAEMLGESAMDLDPESLMDFIGLNFTAWNVALLDALEDKTEIGTLLGLLRGVSL